MSERLARRLINAYDEYTIDDDERGEIELVMVKANPEPKEEGCEPWLREGHREP